MFSKKGRKFKEEQSNHQAGQEEVTTPFLL